MSASNAADGTNEVTNGTTIDLELDVTKLHSLPSEQQDLYLLTFISDLLRRVRQISSDSLPAHQSIIKKELIKILGLVSPAPSRVIRNNLGRIFADISHRGTRSLVYETINDLLRFINADKGEKELVNKHAAVVCIGQIFEISGHSATSLSNLACTSLLKLAKQAQNHAGLRGCIAKALGLIVKGLGPSIDEQAARDVWKYARNASNDKAFFVQRHACACLQRLILSTPYFDNPSDFEALKVTIWKVIESSVTSASHAAAVALGAALVKAAQATSTDTVPTIHKPKKTPKKQAHNADEEPENERPASPSPRKSPMHLAMSLPEVLKVLSAQYCRPAIISRRARVGIARCYKYVLLQLPDTVIEENYGTIANHFFADLLSHPIISRNRPRLLLTREIVSMLLEEVIGTSILTEATQLTAARWLIDEVLKRYPHATEDRREPSKRSLTSALSALTSLISQLRSAFGVIGDVCREALFQVVQHPSYTVQIHVAECMKVLAFHCPHQLFPCVTHCRSQLEKELGHLVGPRHSHRRCVAFANCLAAILSVSRSRPLYVSVETMSDFLNFATTLLKASSSSELRVSATQIQVAWSVVGGLLPLGPNFVKIHLSQLLLLWRNALPLPLTRDNAAKRGSLESSFLAHVRECALGAMLVFLEHNGSLLTLDGSRRIATVLQNTVVFLDTLLVNHQSDELSDRLFPALDLPDFAILVRRRVLQCFSKLVSQSHLENAEILSQSNLVSLAVSSFMGAERMASRSLEMSIANATGNFETIWDMSDNWGFGVNGLVRGYNVELLARGRLREIADYPQSMLSDSKLDDFLLSPISRAREHDSILLYAFHASSNRLDLDPPSTQVINAAIELFAVALPLQPPKVQESCLEQLATVMAQPVMREPGRKIAVAINVLTALLGALMVANRETIFAPGKMVVSGVDKILAEIIRRSIADSDSFVRCLGIEAIGRLSNLSGSQFTNGEVNFFVDSIINNRDPHIRAGCAGALGCIHSHVGSMAAGFHLKTIVSVLLTLCKDPHPIVHYWSLQSLGRVADSAGLTFSGEVASSLGMLALVYTSDLHNEEASSLSTSNLEAEHSTPSITGHCVDSLINVLGPDLQDVSKSRNMIMTLVHHLEQESSPVLTMQSLLCLGHLSMYAPAHLDLSDHVRRLQSGLTSKEDIIREISIQGIYALMKRDARAVIGAADAGFEELLWLNLDMSPGHKDLQNVIQTWLQQTVLADSSAWVQRCQEVLSRTRVRPDKSIPATAIKTSGAPDLQDEEVAGFAAAAAAAQGESTDAPTEGQEYLKWQTRTFAMACLSELLALVTKALLPDRTIPAESALQNKIADIVRMAFSASTADVVELRIWGLRIIDQILKLFGKTPDPDFVEASLLEQYQAQIGSALTPAFAADSSPELAAEALTVCATFAATGIVTNVERMGRIFKLLVTGLENISNTPENANIGDLSITSSNAQAMLKMATLSAWAQLQIASIEQKYLQSIIQPYVVKLTPLWLSSLQEFAKLRFEPEISSSFGGDFHSGDLDELYAALNRQVRLSYYQDSWLNIVEAIAILVEKDSDHVFDALDRKLEIASKDVRNGITSSGKVMSFRVEPVAFFFILYGLAFDALLTQSQEKPFQTLAVLRALKKILKPAVSGYAVYQDLVFNETMDAFERLAMTEGTGTQGVLVEIARNLALDHISAHSGVDRDEKLSDDIEQLFELTRVMILVLAGILPTLEQPPGTPTRSISDDETALIQMALEALVDVAEIFPTVIRTDLHASIVHIFSTILATGACQATAVPLALPVFKRFIQTITSSALSLDGMTNLVRRCLSRFLINLQRAQRRESGFALPCAKNTLLAITILLTSAGKIIPPHDPLTEQAISELISCLQDIGLARVAASCVRSLLLASPKTPCEESIARLLYPRLLRLMHDRTSEDPENARALIAHALTSSIGTIPTTGRPAAVAMVLPALLARAEMEGKHVYTETASRLLELATLDQSVLRTILSSLGAEDRSLFEEILRSSSGLSKQSDEGDGEIDSKPTIELRMDF